MKKAAFPFSFPLQPAQIQRMRSAVLASLCAADEGFSCIPVRSIRADTLQKMLHQYDTLFFNGFLRQNLRDLQVTLSARLTSSAGKYICVRGAFRRITNAEIRMSSDFLTRLDQGPFVLNGLSAATPQEAFLLVFEHELCHAIETLIYGKTGHSSRFLALANGLFGHTATRHSLPTRRHEAALSGLFVGSQVAFLFQGVMLSGIVTYIGKQATVMVPSVSGVYRDQAGKRYEKYRVPVEQLRIKK